MASKNLGAVIQRAISDGAFRRQLQSDPAAALRGFNLTPDEIAAVRSGDSSKLMSLGVDQRMSKAFTLSGTGGAGAGATRYAMTGDVSASTTNVLVGDSSAGYRESIVGDPSTTLRAAVSDDQLASTPRAIHDPENIGGLRAAVSDGDSVASRMHDVNVGLPGNDTQDINGDPGFTDASKTFVPPDSADVQRELLDATHGTGDGLGNVGDHGPV